MPILAAIGEGSQSDRILTVSYELAERYEETLVVIHVVPTESFDEYRKSIEDIEEFADVTIRQEEDSAARFAYRVVTDTLEEFDESRVETRGVSATRPKRFSWRRTGSIPSSSRSAAGDGRQSGRHSSEASRRRYY